jgi:hypothetical protein
MMYSQRSPLKTRQFDITHLYIAINGLLTTPIAGGLDAKFISTVEDLGVGNYRITFKDIARRSLQLVGQIVHASGVLLRVTAVTTSSITVQCTLANSGVVATLDVQDITYTAREIGTGPHAITIAYTNTALAGAEVVTVVGNAISIAIETAVSTATQVLAAFNASAAAKLLVSAAISGTAGDAQVTAAAAALASGVNGTAMDAAFDLTVLYHDNSTLY